MSIPAPLPFTLYPLPAGTSLSVHFADGQDRCGVYMLTYEDGTKYVGRALDVVRRCADHIRHAGRAPGKRVVTVHFTPVPPEHLTQREREAVSYCEHHGMRLRNKLLTGSPVGDSPLDATVTEAVQQAFLTEQDELSRLPEHWLRGRSGRAGKANTYRLLEHQAAADALTALAFYLCYALPDPASTEGRFWMLTAPFQRMDDGSVALARLTVQNVETLVVFHHPQHGTIVKTNLAPYPALPADYGSVVTEHYTSNGPMQTVDLDAETTASALCHDTVFRTAARRATVGLMRKGPTAQRRHHDWALADAVYAHIDDLLEITR